MTDNDWKKRLGVVYSTNPDFNYSHNGQSSHSGHDAESDGSGNAQTLKPAEQKLLVMIDRKGRAGKQVTLVKNFIGSDEDLETLAKKLKTKCGVGGSVKDGEIIIQGDCRDKIVTILTMDGYKAKRGN
jgi:translation initiation factor 1